MACRRIHATALLGALLLTVVLVLAPEALTALSMGGGANMAGDHPGGGGDHPRGGEHPGNGKAGAGDMDKEMCKACTLMMGEAKQLADLKQLLEDAKAEAEAAGASKAVAKIDAALEIVEEQHKTMHAMVRDHIQTMHKDMWNDDGTLKMDAPTCPVCGKSVMMTDEAKVVNVRCPISGKAIDPKTVPEDLTREWNGEKVGFCCPACPPAWDKLSDAQKEKKLGAAMPSKDDEAAGHMMKH